MRVPGNHPYIMKNPHVTARFKQKVKDLEETVVDKVSELLKRAEREVPENGNLFAPVNLEFKNPDFKSLAHDITFSIKPSTSKVNKDGRILKMEITSPQGNKITPIFECSQENKPFEKKQLIELLKNEDFIKRVKKEIEIAPEALMKKQLGE